MPSVNPFIELLRPDSAPPVYVANQAPAESGPYLPTQRTAPVNPTAGQPANAAGTSEAVNQHVAIIVVFALLGVWALRATGFSFVVAARVGG
ncbi:MAG TPA: hypothetical protein VF032_19460 [Thermoleophilaceae bacterium]